MALPDTLRPPPPRGVPPPPPKGRRWIWATLLGLAAVGVPAAIVLSRLNPDESRPWERTSDEFVQAIVSGTGIETGVGASTGFSRAYQLLSEKKRGVLPFDVFFEDWSRIFEQRGFIVDHIRAGDHDATGRPLDPISYLLFLGGEQQDHSRLNTMRLDITLLRRGSRYSIADYTLRDVPNPRAAR